MTTYKVAGTRTVAGVEPGGTVTDGDLEGCNIDALISSQSRAGALPPGGHR